MYRTLQNLKDNLKLISKKLLKLGNRWKLSKSKKRNLLLMKKWWIRLLKYLRKVIVNGQIFILILLARMKWRRLSLLSCRKLGKIGMPPLLFHKIKMSKFLTQILKQNVYAALVILIKIHTTLQHKDQPQKFKEILVQVFPKKSNRAYWRKKLWRY